jgi:hypothetical protein
VETLWKLPALVSPQKALLAPLFSMASKHESHEMLPPPLRDAASLGDTTSKMCGIVREGGAPAIYPLTSMVRFDLSSAHLSLSQSRRWRSTAAAAAVKIGMPLKIAPRPLTHRACHRCIAFRTSCQRALERSGHRSIGALGCAAACMPTPRPAIHRAHVFGPPQSWRPRRAYDLGTALTLLTSVAACISRSLAGPDCSRCRSAIVCAQRRRRASSWTLWQGLPRHCACPKVRPSLPPPSMPSHDHT